MTRRALAVSLAAVVAAGCTAGCTAGGEDPRPVPSASSSPDPATPVSKADLATRIDQRLPAIKEVPPERTAEYHALSSACIELSRLDRELTDELALRLGVPEAVRADLRTAAGQCATAPAEAARTLRGVVAALRAAR